MNIEKAYDAWAKQYDLNKNRTRDLDKLATEEILSKYEFHSVLELGCGTGKNTQWLLKKAEQIIGLDFSKEMLAKAENNIKDKRVKFIKTDINAEWKLENQIADLITSSLTLEHIDDLNHIFNQAHQKLKENGLFFICELHPFKQYNGSGARFESENGTINLKVYTHHITDFIYHAQQNSFDLIEIKEWFDTHEKGEIPRLISFVFRKKK